MLHRFRANGSGRAIQGLTLRLMAQAMREGSLDPEIRRTAAQLTARCHQHDQLAQLAALHAYVRDRMRWVPDPDEVEWIQEAATTLREGFGDCDDLTTLLGALARSIGIPVAIVAGGPLADGPFAHVWPAGQVEGRWIAAEVSEPLELGEEIESARRALFPVREADDEQARSLWAQARVAGAPRVAAAPAPAPRGLPLKPAHAGAALGAALGVFTAPAGERLWRGFFGAAVGAGLASALDPAPALESA